MANVTLITGNNGSNSLQGGADSDLIYGFDPNGPQGQVSSISATRVATGLGGAVFAEAPAGDTGRLFIGQLDGTVRILDLHSGQLKSTPFLNIASSIGQIGEGGLIGFAFDPDYAHNGFFYVNVTNANDDTEIRRYRVSAADPNVADPASATLILRIDQPDGLTNHKGGWLGFGPDGYLYAALGDGGGGGDPLHTGQNNNDLLGNILRLDVHGDAFPGDATRNYAIPADNPFVGVDGADEVWAYGLRNPFRNGFDRGLGDLYIADVGQGKFEEIDIGRSGGNYGWSIFEGPDQFSTGTPTGGSAIAPIHFYGRDVGSTVIGGYVYRGQSEGLQGEYFFADEGNGHVFTLHNNGSSWVATDRTSQISANAGAINNPTSFGQDALGNLYIVDIDGDVFRLTPNVVSADLGDDLNGQAGNDMLFGGSGDDTLRGGPGDDQLYGGNGSDVLMGDAGRDMMAGGPGNDRFVIVPGSGAETIADFVAGANSDDRFDVTAFAGLKLTDILNRATQAGADTLIDFGNGDTVTLQNVDRNNLNIDDFIGVVNKTPVDFSGDGKTDLLFLNDTSHGVAIWQINGTQVVANPQVGIINAAGGWHHQDKGDFNGDGKTDLLFLNDTNHGVAIWQMNGTQVVASPQVGTINAAGGWRYQSTGDFNGDGKSDLLFLNDANHGVAVWEMDGTHVVASPQVGTINAAAGWHFQTTGDFNGDGKTDLLFLNDTNHGVAVWEMDGTQVIASPQVGTINAAGGWHFQTTGDFNGDGKSDLLFLNDTNHGVAIWEMDGTQVVAKPQVGTINAVDGWRFQDIGDFNGDRKSDLFFLNDTTHGVAVWQMNGTQVVASPQVGTINAAGGWHYDGLRDFNGDGKTDLLFENDTNHGVAVWLMDGIQVTASPQIGTVNAADGWHLVV
jgi:glucose/arabinose dehydrogenase